MHDVGGLLVTVVTVNSLHTALVSPVHCLPSCTPELFIIDQPLVLMMIDYVSNSRASCYKPWF